MEGIEDKEARGLGRINVPVAGNNTLRPMQTQCEFEAKHIVMCYPTRTQFAGQKGA